EERQKIGPSRAFSRSENLISGNFLDPRSSAQIRGKASQNRSDQWYPRSSAVGFCLSDFGDYRGPQIGPLLPGWGGMTRDDGDHGDHVRQPPVA
ncbi:MAG: hypothetical protein WCE73_02630, partial [Candidatus Angelobacter sp.]